MRIWSLHPSLMDSKGLVACWRETLLAQKVLCALTKGYRNHPQLDRFRSCPDPVGAVCFYLHGLANEADARGYRFNRELVSRPSDSPLGFRIPVQRGQVAYERDFLLDKVRRRDPRWAAVLGDRIAARGGSGRASGADAPLHELFYAVPGGVEPWEKIPSHGGETKA